ncbi:uncharacterized protein LOC111615515 [Centruroides sculpturatus]|uniref:uncharacterized protein LOC111615515 n=1 Tax=Centruroides sculpturatus TaxID=218467 RepID=UPI000C6DC14F|nr:uncharacterized protein LOC111615515 [Centruroides sculpturatus]
MATIECWNLAKLNNKPGVIIDCEGFQFKNEPLLQPYNGFLTRQIGYVGFNCEDFGILNFFHPDIQWKKLTPGDKKTVRFCNGLHKLYLAYRHQNDGNQWIQHENVVSTVQKFFKNYGFIFFKGGQIEKCLIRRGSDRVFKIDALDVEKYGVPKSSEIKIPCPYHQEFIPHCSLCDCFSYKYFMKTELSDIF